MSNRPITFEDACKIIQNVTACIVDGNALSYPVVNEDFNGDDCIEVNWHDEDGFIENTFGKADEYYITKNGILEIWEDRGQSYTLQFLEVANPNRILGLI
jgi:hypothetical protein